MIPQRDTLRMVTHRYIPLGGKKNYLWFKNHRNSLYQPKAIHQQLICGVQRNGIPRLEWMMWITLLKTTQWMILVTGEKLNSREWVHWLKSYSIIEETEGNPVSVDDNTYRLCVLSRTWAFPYSSRFYQHPRQGSWQHNIPPWWTTMDDADAKEDNTFSDFTLGGAKEIKSGWSTERHLALRF